MSEPRTGTVRVHSTRFAIWEPVHFPTASAPFGIDDEAMGIVFKRMLGRLMRRGWSISRDPRIEEHHPTLGPRRRRGRKGDLHMRAGVSGRCVEIEFFLDEVFNNTNGHEYDFNKATYMTPEQQLRTIVELTSLVRKGLSMGYGLHEDLAYRMAWLPLPLAVRDMVHERRIEEPLACFNRSWGADRFKRDETGWPAVSEYDRDGRNRDAQGRPVRNGEVRYARDYETKRVIRGVAYTNINSMWRLETGVGPRYFNNGQLSLEPPEPIGRFVPLQRGRLETELARATKARDFARVGVLAEVLQRQAAQAAAE